MSNTERIPPEILKKVRLIELSTRHLVDDLFGGEYHSVFKGMGMEFDEVRSIDWNVTARMGRPFVKRYREERELTVLLVVDASASGLFGSADRFKSEVITEVASVLAFSAIRNQDKVGCLIFTDRVEKYIPPDKGHRHVLRIIRELLYFKPEGGGTDLGGALETVSRLLKRKAVVFLLSDFIAEGYETPLRLAAQRHDLIALSIHDPLERELPDVGLLHLRDAETGKDVWLDTSSRWVRKHFSEEAGERRQRFAQLCGRYGVDEIPLDVTRDTVRPLVQFFRKRIRRLAKGGGRGTRAGLLAGLLLLTPLGAAWAQTAQPNPQQRAPAVVPAPPGTGAQGKAGAMPGAPGGMPMQGQGLPVIPREQLEKLEFPGLDEITADARPRLSESRNEGLTVISRLARDLQTIGERNELRWTIILDEGSELLPFLWDLGEPGRIQPWPELDESGELDPLLAARISTGEPLGIADFIQADTLRGAGPDTLRWRLSFTTFLPDTFLIPAQRFAYRLPGDSEPYLVETEPLELACIAVLPLTPDSSALRDWKAPGELRADWWPLIAKWGLPILLVLALGAGLLIWWWRRRRAEETPEPVIPADVEAIAALESLALADLPAHGAFHEYYFQLSGIVRRYLGHRFALPFADWTTEEIRQAIEPPLPRLRLETSLCAPLLADLDRADLVKFAHRTPSRGECLDSMRASRRLIKATRLMHEAESLAAAEAAPEPEKGGEA